MSDFIAVYNAVCIAVITEAIAFNIIMENSTICCYLLSKKYSLWQKCCGKKTK